MGVFSPILFLEGVYNLDRGKIFFVMYKKWSYLTVIRLSSDPTQYYVFDLDTLDKLVEFTEYYPSLDAFMEKARLWVGGDEQISVVTPYQVMNHDPNSRDLDELYDEWDEYQLSIE
ncbi:hypothetical protein IW261DRAFT_1574150 [Armillaria novae-zelandiae]|uniref:Uncharacterized protein n=1 Tax=Armillaria novae-zelandiae TaxID=153914 RepID=A0AA39TV77_9AGAR|nr:hypothetical protein IW261DRAFT_1574150 [Armillaria novae-zelandiae]